MINTLIFDVDGTLVDTKEFIVQAFEHTLKELSLPVPDRAAIFSVIGKPLALDYQELTGQAATDEMCRIHREFQNKNQHLVKLFPFVLETLQTLKDKGVLLVAWTNRSKITSLASLKQVGLDEIFDLVLSIEDVANPKPAPDGIGKALAVFGRSADEAMMIGDREVDVAAGQAAGVKTAQIIHETVGGNVAPAGADYLIHDIREILNLI